MPNTSSPDLAKKTHRSKYSFTKKRLFIVIAVVLLAAAGVTAFVLLQSTKTTKQPTLSDAAASQSAKPGTYITIAIDNGNISDITSSGVCLESVAYTDGYTCKLDESNPTVTLTANATHTREGKQYSFVSWEGCTEQNIATRACTATVVVGKTLSLKASYALKSSTTTQSGNTAQTVPHIVVTMNNQTFDSRDAQTSPVMNTQRIAAGSQTAPLKLGISTPGLTLSSCVVADFITLDDAALTKQQITLPSVDEQTLSLVDGKHSFVFECPDASGAWLSLSIAVRAADGLPKKCAGFNFNSGTSTITTLEELKSGIVGSWGGCVTTPWAPAYYVDVTFKADGTYTATSTESIDGMVYPPMYYGGQQTSAKDTYGLTSFSNGLGSGNFVIYFDNSGTTTNDDLTNVKLTGNKLSFGFKHFNTYGPINYTLYRQ